MSKRKRNSEIDLGTDRGHNLTMEVNSPAVQQESDEMDHGLSNMLKSNEGRLRFWPIIRDKVVKVLIPAEELVADRIEAGGENETNVFQVKEIDLIIDESAKDMRLLMRIGKIVASDEIIDCVPPQFMMTVNGTLRKLEKNGPIDLTQDLALQATNSNKLSLKWVDKIEESELPWSYAFTLYWVENLVLGDLMKSMINASKFPMQKSIIQAKLWVAQSGKEKTSLSVDCPITASKIRVAAKGRYCAHLSCFDLENILQMAIKTELVRIPCPICSFSLKLEDITQDELFQSYVDKANEMDTNQVVLNQNGQVIAGVARRQLTRTVYQALKDELKDYDEDNDGDDWDVCRFQALNA